ncbi:YjcZ family sporulation protein [Paenibacillus sp. N3/727]|nr:YjcZ family sporulation protein [Paenibacillus sp. N3/727]UNK16759.1 YjcZ family sporulation protein [Paenibacillus sp. N3/727]
MIKRGGINESGAAGGYGGYGMGSSVGAILELFMVIITGAFI